MATIKICDLCKKTLDRYLFPNTRHYSLRKWRTIKMEICGECMEKFLEWANLPSQANVPPMPKCKPPKDGNMAQRS